MGMTESFMGRQAVTIENNFLRVTVLREGGHIAEILDKRSGINPLWIPPWPSIEPSTYDRTKNAEYGDGPEAPLLAGIMGHNLCLDIFGAPSPEEDAAGIPVHGEMSVARCSITASDSQLKLLADLPLANLRFERHLELHDRTVKIREIVENTSAIDRPIAWTQHVTLGPPFLERGQTEFRTSSSRSKVFEGDFGTDDYLQAGAEFAWPNAPCRKPGFADLRILNDASVSSGFTSHLMNADIDHAFFLAFSPASELAFGYVWKRDDFPWLGMWEENHSRLSPPWNGKTLTLGMEFGVSPVPESRRKMIDRNSLFGVPTYRWLPAKSRLEAEYWVVAQHMKAAPESLAWPGSSVRKSA
jgi:hypothetical protein